MNTGKWIRTPEFKEKMKNIRKGITFNTGRTHFKKGHVPVIKPITNTTRHKMSIAKIGTSSNAWKGGKTIEGGDTFIWNPKHPFCNNKGYIKRSRFMIEKKLKRYLTSSEVVHHINGIKDDDRIKNLKLFNNHSIHMYNHWKSPKYKEYMSLVHKS